MSDFSSAAIKMRASQKQTMKMSQSMRLTQKQQLALKLLSLSSQELRSEIYEAVEKNPALELASDFFEDGSSFLNTPAHSSLRLSDYERYGGVSSALQKASDDFQAALESNADERTSLQDHLLHQIRSMRLSRAEQELCSLLVQNLNAEGHHILAPVSLLDKMNPKPSESFLEHCISIIQKLDPVGVCVTNTAHSLLVQALDRPDAPKSAIFLLNGHFDFLNPPIPEKMAKKANRFLSEQKKLLFQNSKNDSDLPAHFSEDEMKEALSFIRSLDPHPARAFGTTSVSFVQPDIVVESVDDDSFASSLSEDGSEKIRALADGSLLIGTREGFFLARLSKIATPILKISEEFLDFSSKENGDKTDAESKFARESVLSARSFIDGVAFRSATLLKATAQIVRLQASFFRSGERFLIPLRQKDVAGAIGVHESTISRMASGKFLLCSFGVFPLSHFFTNAVNEETVQMKKIGELSGEKNIPTSKEGVKAEISAILEEHKTDSKPLSDQKISEELLKRGIKIARRTVAKYRSELNVSSSYFRS